MIFIEKEKSSPKNNRVIEIKNSRYNIIDRPEANLILQLYKRLKQGGQLCQLKQSRYKLYKWYYLCPFIFPPKIIQY